MRLRRRAIVYHCPMFTFHLKFLANLSLPLFGVGSDSMFARRQSQCEFLPIMLRSYSKIVSNYDLTINLYPDIYWSDSKTLVAYI